LVSNVYVHSQQYSRLERLIDELQPDVIGLIEVNSEWLRKLDYLRSAYAFHFEVPDETSFGLALYSKLPLSNARILNLGESGTSAIEATMETPDGEIKLILAHPMSPLDAVHVQRRNAQLRALGRYVSEQNRPVVLAGDLNSTMWNRHYREFAEVGSLHNARARHGVGPTWPAVPLLGVPIDHVLATAPVQFRNFRVLDDVGSDHLPVSVEFSLR
jgi:endonuclease/exonuclease/phosphatase (EEP) superfamily protein YafD